MTDYYVKNGGNDEAAGTSDETAWATVAKVNDYAEATGFASGDTINFNRGDTWASDETLGNDGSAINWGTVNGLTIQAYGTGNKPWLNGNTQRPIFISDADTAATGITNLTIKDIDVSGGDWWTEGWFDGNVRIEYCAGVTIDGVDFNGHTGASDNGPTGALYIGVPHGDLEIKNCTIQNVIGIGGTLGEWGSIDAHGIIIIWTVGASPAGPKTSGTISIHDNIIHDVEADCIQLMGMQCTTNVYDNKMYNFGENALDFKGAYNTTIYNNEFYRGDYDLGGSGGGTGNIVFHNESAYTCTNITIRDNYIHTSDYIGIRLLHGTDVDIYRNYFKDITCGVQMVNNARVNIFNNVFDLEDGEYSASALDAGIYVYPSYQSNSSIFNNTFYLGTNHRYGIYTTMAGASIRNNVIYCTRNNSDCFPLRIAADVSPTVEYNAYYNPNHANRVRWYTTNYSASQEATYKSAHDAGAVFAAPGISPTADIFWPTSATARVVKAGTVTGTTDADPGLRSDSTWTPTFSIETQARETPPGIGAYEIYVVVPNNNYSSDPHCKAVWLLNNNGLGGLTLTDEIAGHTLTNNGATLGTTNVPEGSGQAAFVSASSQYLTIASSSSLPIHTGAANKDFTICGWFTFADDAGPEALIAKYNSSGDARSVYLGRNADEVASAWFGYNSGGTGENVLHASVLSSGTKYFIALSFDNDTYAWAIRIRDAAGDAVGTDATGTATLDGNGLSINDEPWYIGANNGTADFDGSADMICFFDRVLTADEITDLAEQVFYVNPTFLPIFRYQPNTLLRR